MANAIIKYLIIPLALLLLACIVFWYFDLDAWRNIQIVRETIAKNKAILAERELLAKNLEKLIAQYQGRPGDVAKINQIIPVLPGAPDLLVMLEALASGNALQFGGVDFNIIRPVTGPAAQEAMAVSPGLRTIQMNARIKGSYPNFLNYLKAVETNIRFLDTTNVMFNVSFPSVGPLGPSVTEFTLTINAYYQPQQ